jgi:hypothetical protein
MAHELPSIDISDQPELVRLAEEVRATNRPRVLRRDGEDLALLVPLGSGPAVSEESLGAPEARIWADVGIRNPHDPWAGYDPERIRAALRRSAGALAGVDRDALLEDLAAAREQDTRGRPA